ncbi:MAG: transglycosylase domain-containing protein, partial [Aggregatilineales bacterium]
LFISAGIFTYAWIFAGLPDVNNLEAGLALPSTRIYDRNEKLLYEILPSEQGRNTVISLDDMSQHCINAIIATEDANYFSHPGVDMVGIARALWINVRGGEVIAGGSTITQQTARLLLLDPAQQAERTLQRKLKEMVLALQLNQQGKNQVLELYLNQVYFGNLAYGIEAAARTYFHKSAPELSLAECSLLAGMVQNAVLHDPLSNYDNAKARQQVALELMVKANYITQVESDTALRDELQFGATPFPIDAPHFVMAVWKQLEREYGVALYTQGLDVITTVDLDWTNLAERVVQQQLDLLNNPPNNSRVPANAQNAALVAIDPYTGQVLTMLGSPNYFDEEIDGAVNAALAMRQPGSALKPFTYAVAMNPALEQPFTAGTMILDVETPFVTRKLESYTPGNYGLVEHGPVLIREALASSYNIPAVVALEHTGIQDFIELSANIGMENLAQNSDVDLSITLGGGETRLLDMAQAYSIFPNGGHYIEPQMILSVQNRAGEMLYEWQQPALERRVLDERIAYLITDMLSDNSARMPAFGAYSPLQIGRPAAAKTGTTTDWRDNWVMGYTSNLVVGVWVGNANNDPMVDVTGVSGAGPIWHMFMRQALLGQPELDFQRPDGLIDVEICALSGKLPTDACVLTRNETYIPGTEPTDYDEFYQVFELDRRTGLLADETTPDNQRIDETFIILPQEARDWAIRNGIRQPPPNAAILAPDANQTIRLLDPDPYTVFEISPVLPIETQRLRLTVGTPPETVRVHYILNGERIGMVSSAPWVLWWQLEAGEYTLVAEAELTDGTTQRSDPVPFEVANYAPLEARELEPAGD